MSNSGWEGDPVATGEDPHWLPGPERGEPRMQVTSKIPPKHAVHIAYLEILAWVDENHPTREAHISMKQIMRKLSASL